MLSIRIPKFGALLLLHNLFIFPPRQGGVTVIHEDKTFVQPTLAVTNETKWTNWVRGDAYGNAIIPSYKCIFNLPMMTGVRRKKSEKARSSPR
jgi:hypothetical protein